MAKAERHSHSRDTINLRGMLLALVPLLISVIALGAWLYASQDTASDRTWKIGAERRGSDNFELLEALAAKASSPADGVRIGVFQTAGSSESLKLLEDGIIDFAAIPADAISRPDLAMVANLYPDT
jgi:TRAP-type uncharacterized transport system substrate-binding protein